MAYDITNYMAHPQYAVMETKGIQTLKILQDRYCVKVSLILINLNLLIRERQDRYNS